MASLAPTILVLRKTSYQYFELFLLRLWYVLIFPIDKFYSITCYNNGQNWFLPIFSHGFKYFNYFSHSQCQQSCFATHMLKTHRCWSLCWMFHIQSSRLKHFEDTGALIKWEGNVCTWLFRYNLWPNHRYIMGGKQLQFEKKKSIFDEFIITLLTSGAFSLFRILFSLRVYILHCLRLIWLTRKMAHISIMHILLHLFPLIS